ncbi:unnamed protein product [Amoebophrya sp. A25]|nr:unnamed protein product [Amoebophrya sp. A25]|eukprot:GSA25T00005272001.1
MIDRMELVWQGGDPDGGPPPASSLPLLWADKPTPSFPSRVRRQPPRYRNCGRRVIAASLFLPASVCGGAAGTSGTETSSNNMAHTSSSASAASLTGRSMTAAQIDERSDHDRLGSSKGRQLRHEEQDVLHPPGGRISAATTRGLEAVAGVDPLHDSSKDEHPSKDAPAGRGGEEQNDGQERQLGQVEEEEFRVSHPVELSSVKHAIARAPPMARMCHRGSTNPACAHSARNLKKWDEEKLNLQTDSHLAAPGGVAQDIRDEQTLAAAALRQSPDGAQVDKKSRHLAAHTAMTVQPGHRIYKRIKSGSLLFADANYVNVTTLRNTTFHLPVQPPSVRIYQPLVTNQPTSLLNYAEPFQISFEELDQECKNAVTNFVIYEGITFAADECRSHCQLKPFHTSWPAACHHDVCDLWVKMLTKESTGIAPCRKYICYIAPYLAGNTGHDMNHHCGARFLRDAYTFCDWTHRGGSMWAGANSRVPGQLTYPVRAQYGSYPVRARWADLTIEEKTEFTHLGWAEQTWPNRRFTLIFAGDSAYDVYAGNTTMTVKKSWYSSWAPSSEFMCYEELSEVQKDAARKLHYTIDGWHANADIPGLRDHCDWPQYLANEGVYRVDGELYDCMKWRGYLERALHRQFSIQPWSTMTVQRREAYTTLGYNTPQSWDQRNMPDTFVMKWDKLTTSQRGAAEFLMYTEDTWNGCAQEFCIYRLLYAESLLIPTRSTDFRKIDWNMFADFQKVHLEQLGWQADSWNDGGPIPATMYRTWNELTPTLQTIARKYGHSEDTWARCPDTPCLMKYDYIQRKYTGPWARLSPRVQRTFIKLGWTQPMWDNKQAGISQEMPDTYRKLWKDLSVDEQLDAMFFDYDEFSWNGCAGADQPQTTTLPPPSTADPFRRIRARLYMPRSFNEIMSVQPTMTDTTTPEPAVALTGDAFSTTIAPDTTTGFVKVAQQAIARTLFCNNPDYNPNTNPDQRDPNGMPLCMDKDPYDRQLERIIILNVGQGILMDFEVLANRTGTEVSAVNLFARLLTATNNPQSDFRHDADFQRFSSVAQLSMLTFSESEYQEEQANLQFEFLRARYDEETGCQLFSDKKHDINMCPIDSAHRASALWLSVGFLAMWPLFTQRWAIF